MNKNFKKILVVRTDRIGDVILTTPAIKALRNAYPEAHITVLVTPMTKELVEGNECIDEVLVDDRHGVHNGLKGYLKLIAEIRHKQFDCALIYHTKKRTNALCFLSGIPVRIGYKNNKFGFLLTVPLEDKRHRGEQHEAQYCLDVLKELDIDARDLSLYVPVNERSLQWVSQFQTEYAITDKNTLIGIHPGASDSAKQWTPQRFAQLIDALRDRYGATIVLIGNALSGRSAQTIQSLAKNPVIDLTGATTVGQLAALMTRCDLLISNDSGPVHVAAGVGTPVISIFTRNQPGINPERWRPLGERSRVVSVKPSQNAHLSFQQARSIDTKYLELIEIDEVLEEVDALFKLC